MQRDNSMVPINDFHGQHFFLSNFYPCAVLFEGEKYPSVEAAFQAAKTLDKKKRQKFTIMSPDAAKSAGRRLQLREDWETVKDGIMEELLKSKFSDPNLKERLVKTGRRLLIEGNYWHDNYWGVCSCPKCSGITGQNHLGKLLMKVRKYYRDEVLGEYDKYQMCQVDLAARKKIKDYLMGVISRSAAEPQNEDLIHENDSLSHLVLDGCGDQYIVMAQEAHAREFQKVIDIGCDLGYACYYFQVYGIDYIGVEAGRNYSWVHAPCDIVQMTYPEPITNHIKYDRETTMAISSLCIGYFEPIEEQYAQLSKDFKHVLITLNQDTKDIAAKYFTLKHLDGDIWYMVSKV